MSTPAGITIEPEGAKRPSRRRRSVEEKRRIVEETYIPGNSVARVAREHGVNANLVFTWRRRSQRVRLGGNVPAAGLLPVAVSDSPAPEPTACSVPSGSIQLRLPKGQLRVDGAVDPASLRIVLQYLLG